MIEESDPVSSSMLDGIITRCRGPRIFLPDIPDTIAEGLNESGSTVGRSVIDDNDFMGWKGLGESTLKGFAEAVLRVVNRDGNGDFRHQIGSAT